MGKTLTEIAQTLKDTDKKVQLIYAFNGVGKTRLSREFKDLVAPKTEGEETEEEKPIKVLYYNAFTEDLFFWDNDLDEDTNRKLIIHPNSFTDWIFKDQGQESNIITHFQHYTNDKESDQFERLLKKLKAGPLTRKNIRKLTSDIHELLEEKSVDVDYLLLLYPLAYVYDELPKIAEWIGGTEAKPSSRLQELIQTWLGDNNG